ncbi:oxidoreductase [Streptomyces sp. NPDC047117]|uniref:oxidoreductase n=1 Tax=Streptomyces sp. NPDC047117 TaxID=3155379 RepID=UPI0034099BEC
MREEDLTDPERRLWQAFATGTKVDLRDRAADGADGANSADGSDAEGDGSGSGWGPERTVRASVIRALLLGSVDPRAGETPVVHLVGARIAGRMDLVFCEARCVLRLEECRFEEAPQLYGAKLHVTGFARSYLPGLGANSVTVGGHLDLMHTRISGALRLTNARIDGSLLLQGALLDHPGAVALDGSWLEIGGGIVCHSGFRAEGEMRLSAARVGQGLHLQGARLHHPGGDALYAPGIHIGSHAAFSDGFHAEGAIDLTDATIGGRVSFHTATVRGTGARGADDRGSDARGTDCRCRGVTYRHLQAAELDLSAARLHGSVDLQYAQVGVLHLPVEDFACPLHFDGLEYRSLRPQLPAGARLPLVARDPDGYRPQPYQQLAAVYQSLGHDHDARAVLLAKQRHRRSTLGPAGRAWGHLLDATVGYGYRPWLAGLWLTALTLLGTAVFSAAGPTPVKEGEGAPFQPLVYTLDLLVPIGALGQRNAWYWTTGLQQFLAYALIAVGWLLTTAVVAGVSRVLNRN